MNGQCKLPTIIKVAMIGVPVAAFTIPIFRSGGRKGLTFYQFIKEHTIFGSPIQYVPEEDYKSELIGSGYNPRTGVFVYADSQTPQMF